MPTIGSSRPSCKLEETAEEDCESSRRSSAVPRRSKPTLSSLPGARPCPTDLAELLSVHEERQGQKMAKSDELTQEIEDLQMQLDSHARRRTC